MLFQSPVFLFLFLPVVYLIFWTLKKRASRYVWLTLSSYFFYGYLNPTYCLILLLLSLVTYGAGLAFLKADEHRRSRRWRKFLLVAPISLNLLVLCFFKYSGSLSGLVSPLAMLLPVGLSFYTFHSISYIADCWRRDVYALRNWWEFSCYFTMFWKLLAGPIVRLGEVQEEIEHIDRSRRKDGLESGWSFFIIGLAQKVLIADTIGSLIDPGLSSPSNLTTPAAWLCVLGYSYQIYFDFAGYSNMAIGVGRLFGMHVPINFDSPYQAFSPPEFWRRWHVSMSRFLSDYVFAALGGARKGERAISRNLLLTMLIFGLWHGASLPFLAWGSYHGLLLVAYRRYADWWESAPLWMQQVLTFTLVTLGWILFRAQTLPDAGELIHRLFVPQAGSFQAGSGTLVIVLVIAAFFAHRGPNTFEMNHRWRPSMTVALALLLLTSLVAIHGSDPAPFVYFRF